MACIEETRQELKNAKKESVGEGEKEYCYGKEKTKKREEKPA